MMLRRATLLTLTPKALNPIKALFACSLEGLDGNGGAE